MSEPTADDGLAVAVEAAVRDASETPGLIVTGFLVIAATAGFDGDGERIDAVTIVPHGMPNYGCLGLLEEARIRFHADTLTGYDTE